jgi:hypothetical protein
MDDRKFKYEIYNTGSLKGLGEPCHQGVLWARDKDAAIDSAFTIARMYGVTNATVFVDEIKLELVK